MHKPSFSQLDILVVDPSPHMSSLVVQMLRHLKVGHVEEAPSSSAALARLNASRFAVVIVEDQLAPMDGVALTRALRAGTEYPSRNAAVIMLSSTPDAARIAEARDAGITEFLRKPFAAQQLAARLESIQTRPRDFIDTSAYAGPDRRRREKALNGPDRRSSGTH